MLEGTLYAEKVVSVYTCTHASNTFIREVRITHRVLGCEVIYIKNDETGNPLGEVIYSAQNSTRYCDGKGAGFVTKTLEAKYGWTCQLQ